MALVLASMFFVTAFATLRDAKSILREERTRTISERTALAAFADEVANIPVSQSAVTGRPSSTLLRKVDRSGCAGTLQAYRDTVMAMPHYDEEYDEPIEDNMTVELGADVTMAVLNQQQLTEPLRDSLESKARTSSQRRDRYVSILDEEFEDLKAAEADFSGIVNTIESMDTRPLSKQSFDELATKWNRVGDLDAQCVDRLTERQVQIHATNSKLGLGMRDPGKNFQEYLYSDLDTPYPILREGVGVLGVIRTARRNVFRALTAF